ncbi:hypothetical protein EG329_005370 [Mollisiaceae sp. DMI_Dod_QoI]|nr:hypothetical protein EG329_005370 [Helotiales sp. DMI_Dod_QoI]
MYRTSARPAPLDFLLPSAHSSYDIDRRKDIGISHPPPQLSSIYFEAPLSGLRTPPADDMATTYQNRQYNPYPNARDSAYPPSGASASSYGGTYSGSSVQSRPYTTSSQSISSSASALRREVQGSQSLPSQPLSPASGNRSNTLAPPEDQPRRKGANGDLIRPNLQIPASICEDGGSLAEFAAQITCLFWFESTETLRKAEGIAPSSSPIKPLEREALPSSGFRKWVVTILSTTQVTDNVILLALLFIYRLKTSNPAVKGRSGSEYRLLTVALMLGNKFLDDNTYTNKTWAEVSGISVTEIHVMEVEFLSNMRYSLLASEKQWAEWHQKLRKFRIYCERAANAPLPPVLPQALPAPSFQSTLPSPPSLQPSPPHTYPVSSDLTNSHHYQPPLSQAPLSSPLSSMPELDFRGYNRKRNYDGEAEEPVAKRVTRPATTQSQYVPNLPPARTDIPRLPVPNLTISTSQPMVNGYNSATSMAPNVPLLPPPNGRAMSTVYPSTPSSWGPQLPMLTPTGPSPANNGYTTPSRRHSPGSVHDLLSYGSSPISGSYPNHTPGHISPSVFLQQRSSPYKPVRHVNTLLYPPPSASMHDYSVNADQMHYQPLGKRNDYRAGVVPDYAPHPSYHYPVLPQPNFHS